MKNLLLIQAIVVLLAGSIFFTSCQKENPQEILPVENALFQNEIDVNTVNTLLKETKLALIDQAVNTNSALEVTFEVVKNLKTGAITLANFNQISFLTPLDEGFVHSRKKINSYYVVYCNTDNDYEAEWIGHCETQDECGGLVMECADEGGCSTVCGIPRKAGKNHLSSVLIGFSYP